MTEKELQSRLYTYLSHYFYVESEVKSTCYTRRIDLIIVHKSDIATKYPIGIEIKTFEKKTGSDAGKWLHQAQAYAGLSWIGYDKAMIIVAPQFSEKVFCEGELMVKHVVDGCVKPDHNVSTFLGQFSIGEFQRYIFDDWNTHKKTKFARIVYNGFIIWDEHRDDFRIHNYERLCKR